MKTLQLREGTIEPWYSMSDTYVVPPVGSTVTYRGPAFGDEGSGRMRFARIICTVVAIIPGPPASPPEVRLHSAIHGDAGCDVDCLTLSETTRDAIALLREKEQTCAAWLAQHRAGQKDGTGKSFAGPIAAITSLPGVEIARIERIAASFMLTKKYNPWLPGNNELQDHAMAADGFAHRPHPCPSAPSMVKFPRPKNK